MEDLAKFIIMYFKGDSPSDNKVWDEFSLNVYIKNLIKTMDLSKDPDIKNPELIPTIIANISWEDFFGVYTYPEDEIDDSMTVIKEQFLESHTFKKGNVLTWLKNHGEKVEELVNENIYYGVDKLFTNALESDLFVSIPNEPFLKVSYNPSHKILTINHYQHI